VTILPRAKC